MDRKLTKEELIKIWNDKQMGKNPRKTGMEMGLNYSTVMSAYYLLRKYANGFRPRHTKNSAYQEAHDYLHNDGVVTTTATEADPYKRLDDAFNSFMVAVQDFVELQVTKKVMTELGEMETLKEENRKLKGAIEKGKTSNWINNLRQRWGN